MGWRGGGYGDGHGHAGMSRGGGVEAPAPRLGVAEWGGGVGRLGGGRWLVSEGLGGCGRGVGNV